MILDVVIPNVAESITEVTLGTWMVKDGDYVTIDQAICEVETDKASQELIAEKAGKIKLIAKEGDDIEVGGLIAQIDTDAQAPAQSTEAEAPKVETPKVETPKASEPPKVIETSHKPSSDIASPAASKMMREQNITAQNISGTGKDGRITKEDVLKLIQSGNVNQAQAGIQSLQSLSKQIDRQEEVKKMSRIRKVISERLVFAKNSTAMLTTFNEVNMQPIMDARAKYKDLFKEKHGVNLGFMSFFTRACSLSLMKFPEVNAYIDVEKGELIYHNYADISIAVSTPKGLVVPVIRNAESLSMHEIEQEVGRLAKKGREGSLTMEDMDGGTFTITNGGVFGSLLSTPIINPPQSAILGMHKIEDRPVVENGQIVIRPMMYLALSYDHRIIDGKESVGFLVSIKNFLENPEHMLIGQNPLEALFQL
ncbi:MAG: 2-oxoglutarate dehydrogenase complex dihydrolipoyllysine-residue succinyltransferase [Chitinophagales bacterium]|jgi:2-oxoglutarate dehydrogenase E2 component (dihydrolipoamide succinyltransferase)|nr:2-oxoglutarate dehydrogenase complex dihydrolipoyllysine-residue succinyltransferase [Chitinophagales bacterium]